MPSYKSDGKKTLDEAFKDAAKKAIDGDPKNDDEWFDAKISAQITKNPGIKEYKVEITRP